MPGGRPSKLTTATRDALVAALEAGNYREVAVRAAGIGLTTFHRWMEQGEADIEHGKDTPHAQLREAVLTAEATGEQALVKIIRDAAANTWQAAAWMLERKHPDRYARRDRHVFDTPVQVQADVEIIHNKPVLVIPAPERRQAIAQIYQEAVNGGGSAN